MIRLSALVGAMSLAVSIAAATPASAQQLVYCASEGGFCRVPYPTTVVYGFRGHTTAVSVGGRGIPCNNAAFGDPAPNVPKSCSFVARGHDRGPRRYYDEPPPRPRPYYERPYYDRRDYRYPRY